MALILLVSALLLGAAIVWWLRLPVYPFEAAALVIVIGLFGWTWLAFLDALVLPYHFAVPLTIGLSAGACAVVWSPHRPQWRPLEGGRSGWILWSAASMASSALLGPLFWTHSLETDPTGVYSAGSTWADFGLHSAIINHLAAFDRMPMDLPVASGAHLTYPYLVDLLSALYLRDGWSLHFSLFLPGILLALAICRSACGCSVTSAPPSPASRYFWWSVRPPGCAWPTPTGSTAAGACWTSCRTFRVTTPCSATRTATSPTSSRMPCCPSVRSCSVSASGSLC
jgi:hypothetical protein